MKFNILTIFPSMFDSYLKETFISKGIEKGLIEVNVHNLRDFTDDPRRRVDDSPFGGGLGMVIRIEPIYKAIQKLKDENTKVVVFSPRGEKYNQLKCAEYSKCENLILVSGRYEGIDERVLENMADEVISIGDYDLMGGELPSMIVVESVSRLIPGVLGKECFLEERMTKEGGFIEYPQYTRPEVFVTDEGKELKVPDVLLSGNHKEISAWREKRKKVIEN
ncbi:MAG: tRNA (guanosine(37)-N1)-methyltransferase TrmD [Candidatus Pacebacteria bacterium]|nr:tRNA (guanosine(37)-N1)-methyltransferase TrmD [Candidatus Paceibacterota bacterium]